jgi:hypothetical protein
MKTKQIVILVLACWCVFWWGFSLGMRTSADSELAQLTADAQLAQQLRASCAQDCPVATIESLEQMRTARTQLLKQTRADAVDLIFAPVTAPIGAIALAGVRQEANP